MLVSEIIVGVAPSRCHGTGLLSMDSALGCIVLLCTASIGNSEFDKRILLSPSSPIPNFLRRGLLSTFVFTLVLPNGTVRVVSTEVRQSVWD